MKLRKISAIALLASTIGLSTLSACDEESTIGASIIDDEISIVIDSTFTISGRSVENSALQSRTLLQLLGRIDAHGYGTLSSDVVAQFMPSASLDTTGVEVNDIDSLKLLMRVYHGNFVGDSITPMGIDVYRLNRDLPSPIYSDFDPTGYYDPSKKIGSCIYNTSTLGESDSMQSADYHILEVTLPRQLGQEFFKAYKDDESNFSSPSAFINNVFKGLYIKNSYGSGRMTLVSQTIMRAYYRRTYTNSEGRDTTVNAMANYFAVTPEVVTNNNIDLRISPDVTGEVAAGKNIVMSPGGYDVEFKFPIPEIIASYNDRKGSESTINSLTLSIPVDSVDNKFGFGPAPYMLLVLKNKKAEFFRDNSLPDNVSSFYATYDESNQAYNFSSMRNYLIEMLEKEQISDDDITFVLTPVNVVTESSSGSYYYPSTSTVTTVTPYISTPTLANLKLDKAKIKFIYSSQKINY